MQAVYVECVGRGVQAVCVVVVCKTCVCVVCGVLVCVCGGGVHAVWCVRVCGVQDVCVCVGGLCTQCLCASCEW